MQKRRSARVFLFLTSLFLVFSETALSVSANFSDEKLVKLRVTAINPSKAKMQSAQVKIYLPEEVKPQDIVEKGELEVNYDTDKSLYYVYKDSVELAPLETRVFEVALKDIWVIPESDLSALKTQAEILLGQLEGTVYQGQSKSTVGSISARLNEIAKTQSDTAISRDQHIGLYRSNLKLIASVKEDLARLDRFVPAKSFPKPKAEKEEPKPPKVPFKVPSWVTRAIFLLAVLVLAAVALKFMLRLRRRHRRIRRPLPPQPPLEPVRPAPHFATSLPAQKEDFFARKEAELKQLLWKKMNEASKEKSEKT